MLYLYYKMISSTLLLMIFPFALFVLRIVANWILFKKAGKNGWESIIPFYNNYVLCDIVWGNGLLFLLLLIPFGGTIFNLFTCYKLARAFGKSEGFAWGCMLLTNIFVPILAFGKSNYIAPATSHKKGCIIATSIVGGVLTFLFTFIMIFMLMFGISNDRINKNYNKNSIERYFKEEFNDLFDNDYDDYDLDDKYDDNDYDDKYDYDHDDYDYKNQYRME